ncbi:VOC family protein [Halalkalibacter alkaliphilus]|uniref:VOC family protein n=1 Tax=Halalkalibacter alkaliphilus TaxID=2917993 RepID=A0A9X2CTE8_9BACI|nr:VOC family protein [Halalkalibacter alkaliphilus]MCL7747901.1 VOC family protein [Halalkalibacter alkaliphilus]
MDIHHIGIVVPDINAARTLLASDWEVEAEFSFMDENLLFLNKDSFIIELIEGDPTTFPFHVAYQVPNLENHMQNWIPPPSFEACGPYELKNGWKTIFYSNDYYYVEFIEKKERT